MGKHVKIEEGKKIKEKSARMKKTRRDGSAQTKKICEVGKR